MQAVGAIGADGVRPFGSSLQRPSATQGDVEESSQGAEGARMSSDPPIVRIVRASAEQFSRILSAENQSRDGPSSLPGSLVDVYG